MARVRAVVRNRSEATANGGRLDLEVPAGWSVAPDPAPVAPLAAGASRAVALAVTVARDARPGDEVTLTARLAHRVLGGPRTATATAGGRVRAVSPSSRCTRTRRSRPAATTGSSCS